MNLAGGRYKSILIKIKLETYFPVKKKGFNRVRKAVTFITNVECRAEGLYTSHAMCTCVRTERRDGHFVIQICAVLRSMRTNTACRWSTVLCDVVQTLQQGVLRFQNVTCHDTLVKARPFLRLVSRTSQPLEGIMCRSFIRKINSVRTHGNRELIRSGQTVTAN